ncbi:hypothetical protein ACKKBG_A17500 [Auxenochlorella protothecoides x Auxenochlorella symbiontica]
MASRELFADWTLRQLQEYIDESGGNSASARSREDLITEAARISQLAQEAAGKSVQAPAPLPGRGPTEFFPGIGSESGPPPFPQAQPPPLPHGPGPAPYGGPPIPRVGGPGQVPAPMPPAGGPGKKAFIVGINYRGQRAELRGCINDAQCMEYMLRTRFGFSQENILLMTEDIRDPSRLPTRYNIFCGIQWLTSGMKPGDSLVFHYSGHGSQQPDYSGEEPDGKNETLCPLDFQQAGEIVDNDLNRYLINPIPQGVKLHAIVDACHSGSVMDLPFSAMSYNGVPQWRSEYQWQPRAHKGTAGGFAVQIGASTDSQTAADTTQLSGYTSTGAATYAFIQAIEQRGTTMTYGELLVAMDWTLHHALGGSSGGGGGGLGGSLLGGMGGGGLTSMLGGMLLGNTANYQRQQPQLSSVYTFDLGFKFSL